MKEFMTVLSFELKQMITKKSFMITMFITAAIFFGITFIPRFIGSSDKEEISVSQDAVQDAKQGASQDEGSQRDKLAVFVDGNVSESTLAALGQAFEMKKVDSQDQLKKMVESEEVEQGIILKSDLEGTQYSRSVGMTGPDQTISNILLNNYKYAIAYPKAGIDPNKVAEVESTIPNLAMEIIGRNTFAGFIMSYFSIMFLYFMILLNGQTISTNVAKEKSSRTMELLITSTKPKYLIYGKVIAGVIASLLLFAVVAISLGAGFAINLSGNETVNEMLRFVIDEVQVMDIVIFVVFSLIGVTMYYFLFAALGSLVSKVEELPQSIAPVTMLVIAAFMVPMFSMSTPDSVVMKMASLVPFTSPLAMFSRFVMTTVPMWEVGLSLAILIVTTILAGILSVRIYRQGTLNYGNRLNPIKALTQKIE